MLSDSIDGELLLRIVIKGPLRVQRCLYSRARPLYILIKLGRFQDITGISIDDIS